MSTTWFEQTRSNLEYLELIDKAIVAELMEKDKKKSDQVMIDWKINNLLNMKQSKCLDASMLLTDSEQKKEELAIITGQKSVTQGKNADVWINFYEKIKEIRQYHKKHANVSVAPTTVDSIREQVFSPPNQAPDFTGEEGNGKYVDMDKYFQEYLNLNFIESAEEKKRHDYLQYLKNFDDFEQIEQEAKEKNYKQYKKYLENLVGYLRNYFAKVQPLTDISQVEKQNDENFEQQWKEGTFKGWSNSDEVDNLSINEIENNPLYCKYCKKLFSNTNINLNHQLGKKHIRAEKNYHKEQDKLKQQEQNQEEQQQDGEHSVIKEANKKKQQRKELAYLESQVMRYKEVLGDIIEDTINNVRKRQTQTGSFFMEDQEQQFDQEVLQESDEDEPIYNPKNLPLGWDGKPIPYWLYKLHGLGIEYKCEICGNYSYWGRRAFERHFQEWRHTYGMKCLKIPNTIHFREITSIKHAQQLHQKMLVENYQQQFQPELDEEYEDNQGNIMNKKTYKDLEKQGLLD